MFPLGQGVWDTQASRHLQCAQASGGGLATSSKSNHDGIPSGVHQSVWALSHQQLHEVGGKALPDLRPQLISAVRWGDETGKALRGITLRVVSSGGDSSHFLSHS